MDVGFQARADAVVRLAITGAAVEREVLRLDVQDHAIAFEADFGGQFDGVGHIGGVDFARTSEFIEAAALRALDMHAADADGDGFHRNLRAAFGIGDGGADGFGDGVLIGHAALGPPLRGGEAVAQVADVAVLQRADHAARARTSRIETDDELCFRGHAIPPP